MSERFIAALQKAQSITVRDRQGVVGMWLRWPGGWCPVILRNDLWKAYL